MHGTKERLEVKKCTKTTEKSSLMGTDRKIIGIGKCSNVHCGPFDISRKIKKRGPYVEGSRVRHISIAD